MCMPARCQNEGCGKTSWWGCGKHIESVMAKVPEEEQCKCPPEKHNAANPATSLIQGLYK